MGFKKLPPSFGFWACLRLQVARPGWLTSEILNQGQVEKVCSVLGREKENGRDASFQKVQKWYHNSTGSWGVLEVTLTHESECSLQEG